jgi:sugar phosphate isomerase/epimerase
MQASRRTFLKTSALLAATSAVMPQHLFASSSKKIQRLGLQLYTVRAAMKTNPAGTLKALSDMDYRHIEHANYVDRKFYGYTAKEMKRLLDDNGLNMMSGHVILTKNYWDATKNDFTDEWKQTIDDAAAVGQKYLISPWLDHDLLTDENALKAFMDVFNKCGKLCRQSDIQFGYHNHDFEFTSMFGDSCVYDVMLTSTDPALVAMQLDIGNMFPTGAGPIDYITKYPGRFELLHVKDQFKNSIGKYENTILGGGIVPVKEILKAARKTGGTTQFIIEQEEYQDKDPLDCCKIDLKVMNSWGY